MPARSGLEAHRLALLLLLPRSAVSPAKQSAQGQGHQRLGPPQARRVVDLGDHYSVY